MITLPSLQPSRRSGALSLFFVFTFLFGTVATLAQPHIAHASQAGVVEQIRQETLDKRFNAGLANANAQAMHDSYTIPKRDACLFNGNLAIFYYFDERDFVEDAIEAAEVGGLTTEEEEYIQEIEERLSAIDMKRQEADGLKDEGYELIEQGLFALIRFNAEIGMGDFDLSAGEVHQTLAEVHEAAGREEEAAEEWDNALEDFAKATVHYEAAKIEANLRESHYVFAGDAFIQSSDLFVEVLALPAPSAVSAP